MPAELLVIHPDNPQPQRIQRVVELLKKGGVIIYPTDTVYGIGCDIHNSRAIERICKIKGIAPNKNNFSFMCNDLSHIAEYTRNLPTPIFKLMKKALPGPYTFILTANNNVPKLLNIKKQNVGIRIPDHQIPLTLVRELGNPIVTTSLKDDDNVLEYTTDPELILERYLHLVDLVIDGGFGGNLPSTIIDCTGTDPEVVREGKGSLDILS